MANNPFDSALRDKKPPGKSAAQKAREAGKAALEKVKAESDAVIAKTKEQGKKAIQRVKDTAHSARVRAREPVMNVLQNEGVRTLSHVSAFWADAFIPIRGSKKPGVLNILARPSTGLALGSFGISIFTKDETSFYSREVGQGAWHQVVAVFNRQMHDWIFGDPNKYDGMGDADTGANPDAASTQF